MNPSLVSPFLQPLTHFLAPSIKEHVKKGKVWRDRGSSTVCFVSVALEIHCIFL